MENIYCLVRICNLELKQDRNLIGD